MRSAELDFFRDSAHGFMVDHLSHSFNPDISYRFVARERKRAWIQGARSDGNEGI